MMQKDTLQTLAIIAVVTMAAWHISTAVAANTTAIAEIRTDIAELRGMLFTHIGGRE